MRLRFAVKKCHFKSPPWGMYCLNISAWIHNFFLDKEISKLLRHLLNSPNLTSDFLKLLFSCCHHTVFCKYCNRMGGGIFPFSPLRSTDLISQISIGITLSRLVFLRLWLTQFFAVWIGIDASSHLPNIKCLLGILASCCCMTCFLHEVRATLLFHFERSQSGIFCSVTKIINHVSHI